MGKFVDKGKLVFKGNVVKGSVVFKGKVDDKGSGGPPGPPGGKKKQRFISYLLGSVTRLFLTPFKNIGPKPVQSRRPSVGVITVLPFLSLSVQTFQR